jgi:hypothetical protein
MQVTVNKELSVNTSGGVMVYYKGTAVIREAKTSGGGSVSKRDRVKGTRHKVQGRRMAQNKRTKTQEVKA